MQTKEGYVRGQMPKNASVICEGSLITVCLSLPLNYLPFVINSLIHAAILKRDIQLVKLILNIGKDDVDQLLKEAIKVKSNSFEKGPKNLKKNPHLF